MRLNTRQKIACIVVCLGLLWSHPVAAASGLGKRPFRIDVGTSSNVTHEILGNLDVDWLCNHILNLRLEAGLGASAYHLSGNVMLGPLLQLDIWTFVPALFVGVGWHHGPSQLAILSRVQVRGYLTFNTGLEIGAGIFWPVGSKAPQPSILMTYFFDL